MKSIRLAVRSAGTASPGGSSSNFGCIEGSGNSTTEDRQMDDFTQISIQGDYQITLVQDNSMLVAITADDNLLQYITTTVSGGALVINTQGHLCVSNSISINVGVGALTSIKASGKDEITAEGTITAEDLLLQCSGAENITINLNATNLSTNINGQGTINLTGSATSHTINISGNGTLNAFDFAVDNFTTQTSGAGNYQVKVADTMTLHTTGSSVVEYIGSPTIVDDNKGSSKITKAG
jgi:hypothetical protein